MDFGLAGWPHDDASTHSGTRLAVWGALLLAAAAAFVVALAAAHWLVLGLVQRRRQALACNTF